MTIFEQSRNRIGKDATVLDVLSACINSRHQVNAPHFKEDEAFKAQDEVKIKYNQAKKFLLNVEMSQNFYSEGYYEANNNKKFHSLGYPSFNLPFPNTMFAFEKPIEINWSLAQGDAYGSYEFANHELAAVMIDEKPLEELLKNVNDEYRKCNKGYRAYLFFTEDPKILGKDLGDVLVSWQWIDFVVLNLDNGIVGIQHISHLCSDKEHCQIKKNGYPENGGVDNLNYCQEYANRKAVVDVMLYIANYLNVKKEVINVEASKNEKVVKKDSDGVFQMVQSPMPSPYYVSSLNDKKYKYDHINVGTGTEHRFRYDVRRHPRIANNRLVWINPYQRGKGQYIPKIYKTHGVLSVPYFWEKVEQFSKVRFIERLMIKIIRLYRRWKK